MDLSRNKAKQIEVLLYYDKAFREDWRFLSKMRIVVAGIYIGLATSILGWMISTLESPIIFQDRVPYLILHAILSIIAITTMGWFGSSLNAVKQLIVKVEASLELFKRGTYLEEDSIIPESLKLWGKRGFWRWGTSIIAAMSICLIFAMGIIFI